MIISISSLSPSSSHISTAPLSFRPLSTLRPLQRSLKNWKKLKKIGDNNEELNGKSSSRRVRGTCRAELALDAPFAVAIGACILTSLVSPISSTDPYEDDEDGSGGGGGAIDTTDARFAVMGIIGFIPYFNWMSWVFAWLDSGKQRYLVYAVVYLAPYLRTNLSLSPEESWLPIASIFLCIIHIQLEASIRNGDLNDIQLFGSALKLFPPLVRKEDTEFQSHQGSPKKGRSKKQVDLPSARNTREEFGEWGTPSKPVGDPHRLEKHPDIDAKENKSD